MTIPYAVLCLVAESCLILCDPMDCNPPGFSVPEDSPGKNTGVGSLFLLQEIFPTQESNRGLLHCRWILYQLSYMTKTTEAKDVALGKHVIGFGSSQDVAAAVSLQSCPTLCDPIDGSPPGFPVPGILQARTLEWVAISFSNA